MRCLRRLVVNDVLGNLKPEDPTFSYARKDVSDTHIFSHKGTSGKSANVLASAISNVNAKLVASSYIPKYTYAHAHTEH